MKISNRCEIDREASFTRSVVNFQGLSLSADTEFQRYNPPRSWKSEMLNLLKSLVDIYLAFREYLFKQSHYDFNLLDDNRRSYKRRERSGVFPSSVTDSFHCVFGAAFVPAIVVRVRETNEKFQTGESLLFPLTLAKE